MRSWVAAQDEAVYGSNQEVFPPKRWTEVEEKTSKTTHWNWLAVSIPPTLQKVVVTGLFNLVKIRGRGFGKNISFMEISNWYISCSRDTTSHWHILKRGGS